jgi:hypothetical protein
MLPPKQRQLIKAEIEFHTHFSLKMFLGLDLNRTQRSLKFSSDGIVYHFDLRRPTPSPSFRRNSLNLVVWVLDYDFELSLGN